ncbi:vinorine synthase-like [Durio zibethinus]|uniref:Vinorine synthase-like n=1 Tax=Durio zibethinus TaxID=66656 RepID=A0A6P5XFV7_DURZI|nr:vinorine synthase-like [Durio zibethinus]
MKLEVEVISKEIIRPSSPTPHQLCHYQLCSLDQLAPPVYNHLVLFYKNKSDIQIDNIKNVLDHLRLSVSKALTYFYPLAGRIKDNLFIDCNDEGIPFKEAHVKCRLADILQSPVPKELNKLFPFALDSAAELPMGIQFNTFDCGGIGIGLCISHKIGDALSYFTFLNTWADIGRGDDQKIVLPEFVSTKLFPPRILSLPEPVVDTNKKNIETKRFVFSASKIEEIRAKYAESGSLENQKRRSSRIEALSAFIWSRFIASTKERSSPDGFYTIVHTVNLRTRFELPLSDQSFGNIYHVAITVPSMDSEKDCDNLVSQMRDSIRKIDKVFVEKLQVGEDLFDSTNEGDENFNKGEKIPFVFTSLCKFPLYEADFGWGKPIWISSATLSSKNLVVFMDTASGDGIEAWINLTEEDMAAFGIDDELLASFNN